MLLFLLHEMYHVAIMQAEYTESVNENIRKVMAHAFFTALVAFAFGLCLAGAMKRFDGPFLGSAVLLGTFVILGIFWTQRAVRRVLTPKYTTSETAKRSARNLVAYCIAFVASTATFGLEMMAALHSPDGFYSFSAVMFGIITCVSFFNVYRGARRLTSDLV
jgi:hypothetical protein